MRSTSLVLLFVLAAMPSVVYGQRPSESPIAAAIPMPDPCATLLSSERIRTAIAVLDGMVGDPAPAGITETEAGEYRQHGVWLSSVRDRLDAHLADRDAAAVPAGAPDVTRGMAALNTQFLTLQEAIQAESRKFQTLSNASKARHDVAMNAIRNLKA